MDESPRGASPRIVEVMDLLRELSGGFTRLSQEMADASGSHLTDVAAVEVLDRREAGAMTVGALGGELGLSKAATTGLVDRLEQAGHVRRVRDDRDRRRVYLETTESAHDVAMTVLRGFVDRLRDTLERYDDAELALAARFMIDVRDALLPSAHGDAGER